MPGAWYRDRILHRGFTEPWPASPTSSIARERSRELNAWHPLAPVLSAKPSLHPGAANSEVAGRSRCLERCLALRRWPAACAAKRLPLDRVLSLRVARRHHRLVEGMMSKSGVGIVLLVIGVLVLVAVYSMRPPSGFGEALMMMGQGRKVFIKEPLYQILMAIGAGISLLVR